MDPIGEVLRGVSSLEEAAIPGPYEAVMDRHSFKVLRRDIIRRSDMSWLRKVKARIGGPFVTRAPSAFVGSLFSLPMYLDPDVSGILVRPVEG